MKDNKKKYTRTNRSKKRIYRKISKKVFANYQYIHLFERIRVLLIHETSGSLDISKSVEIQTGNGTGKKKEKKRKGKKGGKIVLDSRITRLTCENVMRRRNVIKIYIN